MPARTREPGHPGVPCRSSKPILWWLRLALCVVAFIGAPLHADSPATPHKAGDLAFWEEIAFWETIKDSKDPAEFEAYLQAYPKGRFVPLAEMRIKALKGEVDSKPARETTPVPTNRGEVLRGTETTGESSGSGRPAESEAGAGAAPPGGTFKDCDDCPLMVEVPAGTYLMGSDVHRPNEKPRHEVSFARPFAIGVYEVTIGEWDACLREGGCRFSPPSDGDGQLPASNLSWDDAQEYLTWLSKKSGKEYRLPTEAEWEYAASGGRTTAFWWGDSVGVGNANCSDCGGPWGGKAPAPVGSFAPNPFGLHDVHGNLWEWTMDCVNSSYTGAPADGSAWLRGDCIGRILRGGSWKLESDYMRLTRRNQYDRDVRYYLHGFRVARSLP
jgi:formylglycine-generating enzyme required for sulfatase activity